MKIAVVGPGALGCLFAARCWQAGIDTTLVDHDGARAERLGRSGVYVETDSDTLSARPRTVTGVPAGQDLVLVLTKATATRSLRIPPGQFVLTLQNGLGNAEALADRAGADWVLAGSTSQASTLVSDGRAYHAAEGPTVFGPWGSCDAEASAALLRQAGFEVRLTDRPAQVLWEKAIVSAAVNPLTALLDVPNGKLVEHKASRCLLRDLVGEAGKVAAAEGFRFRHSMVEATEAVCRTTSANISSMLQDIREGRPTEIEAITGEILRRGETASLSLPRNKTIYRLIKSLERNKAQA